MFFSRPPPKKIIGVRQVRDEVGVIRLLKTSNEIYEHPDTQGYRLQEENCTAFPC